MSKLRPFSLAAGLVCGIWVLALPNPARSATTTRIAQNLAYPIYVTSPPGDSRLFIIEQRGRIRIYNGQVLSRPFLDLDPLIPNISGSDERGLLGLAFPPDYATSGRFYVNYTDLSSNTVIARYHVSPDPDRADSLSGEILLHINQPYTNHNGGNLAFDPTGNLVIGMGDGGSGGDPENRAQNPLELLGKMLRIDVSGAIGYAIPATNPFVGNPAYRPEIWDLGMRNPYRWSFDRLTEDLYIADVGQNLWEEIDFEPAGSGGGRNYGWRLTEGNHCYNPPTNCDDGDPVITYPIYEYSHSGGACSITGGYVYRGSAIPAYQGLYFFADFCTANIFSFRYNGSVTELTNRTAELAPGGGMSISSIAGFGQDRDGELYIVDRGTGSNGEIYKIVQTGAGAPEEAPAADGAGFLRTSSIAPNPFSGTVRFAIDTSRPEPIQVRVVDPAGRVIRTLESLTGAGRHELQWDGHDEAGRPARSGVYFLRAEQAGTVSQERVSLIR